MSYFEEFQEPFIYDHYLAGLFDGYNITFTTKQIIKVSAETRMAFLFVFQRSIEDGGIFRAWVPKSQIGDYNIDENWVEISDWFLNKGLKEV